MIKHYEKELCPKEKYPASGYIYVSPMKKCLDSKSEQFDFTQQPSNIEEIEGV